MGKASPVITNFNAGELSPMITGRVDFEKYPNGAELMQNFMPTIQGPAVRRAGTRFVAEVKDSDKRVYLQRFEFSVDQAYILEFGPEYIRFFTNNGQLVSGMTPVEVETPYVEADLFAYDGTFRLQFAQSADILYIVHPDYAPRVLKRTSTTTFVLDEFDYIGGPFYQQNITDTQVYASAPTDSVNLRATTGIFTAGLVGSYFRLEQRSVTDVKAWEPGKTITQGSERRSDGKNYTALNGATTGANRPIHTEGAIFDGDLGVQWEFTDPGYGYVRIKSVASQPAAATINVTGTVSSTGVPGGLVRLTVIGHPFLDGDAALIENVGGTTESNGSWFINLVDPNTIELAGSTFTNAYTSGGTAKTVPGAYAVATVIDRLPSNTIGRTKGTTRWSYGAWSEANGYPSSVSFFRERLCFARGQQLWMSVSSAFDDFSARDFGTITADMSISLTIASGEINDIRWMVPDRKLIAGTAGGEFIIGELTNGDPIGPGNVKVELQSSFGSRSIVPVKNGGQTLFVQRNGRRVREIGYNFSSDAFEANDATVLSEHITFSGVIDMDFQQDPYSIVWMTKTDGALVGFTWDNEQNVKSWHRHPTDGLVESVAVIPSPTLDRDEVWMSVKRTIDGVDYRYIEYMERPWQRGDALSSMFYVDSGLTYNGAAATVISGLDHLEGETVDILADGSPHPQRVVTSGTVTLQREASVVNIGLPVPCKVKSMRMEAGSQDGTAQGKTKRIHKLVLRFLDSLGGEVGPAPDMLELLEFRTPRDQMNQPVPLFTGDKVITWPHAYDLDGYFYYQNTQPVAVTLVAVMPQIFTQDAR
jgi:hypothetical protein